MSIRNLYKNMFHRAISRSGLGTGDVRTLNYSDFGSSMFKSGRRIGGGKSICGSESGRSNASSALDASLKEKSQLTKSLKDSEAKNGILERENTKLKEKLGGLAAKDSVIAELRDQILNLKKENLAAKYSSSNSGLNQEQLVKLQVENAALKQELVALTESKVALQGEFVKKKKAYRTEISKIQAEHASEIEKLSSANHELTIELDTKEMEAKAYFHLSDMSAEAMRACVTYVKQFQMIAAGLSDEFESWNLGFSDSYNKCFKNSVQSANIFILQNLMELVSEQEGQDEMYRKLSSLLSLYFMAREWENGGTCDAIVRDMEQFSENDDIKVSGLDEIKSPDTRQNVLEGSQATPVKFFSPSNPGQSKLSERECQKQTLDALNDLFSKMGDDVDLSRYGVVWPTSNEPITARAAAAQLNYIAGSVLSDTDFELLRRAAGMSPVKSGLGNDSEVAVAADVLAQLLVIWGGRSSGDPIRPIPADLLSIPKNGSENLIRLVKNFNQLKEIVVKTLEKYDMIATDTDGKQSIEGSVVELFAQISRMDTLNEENQNLKADNRAKDHQKKLADGATASAKKLYEELLTKYIIGVGTMARSVRERFFEAIGATYAKAAIGMLSDTTEDDRPNIYESYLMPFAGEHVHRAHLQVLVNCLAAEPQFNEGHPLAVTPTELVRTMIYGEPFPSESPGSISREFIFSTLTRLVGERQERFSFAELEREFTPLISAAASNDRSSSGSVDSFSSDNVVIRQRPCAPNIGRLPHQGQFVFSPARGVCSADNTDRTPKKTKPTKPFVVSTPKKS